MRLATADDHDAVESCVREVFEPYAEPIGRPPWPLLADHAEMISRGFVHLAVNEIDEVIGLVVLWSAGSAAQLEIFAAPARSQGTGVGRTMLDFVERWALERGHTTITLYVNAKAPEAMGFWRRMGFVETGRRAESGYDRVYFSRPVGWT